MANIRNYPGMDLSRVRDVAVRAQLLVADLFLRDLNQHPNLTSDITVGGDGGGAPTGASYVVMGLNATLTAERVLTAGNGISLGDGGPGGAATIGVNFAAPTITFGTAYVAGAATTAPRTDCVLKFPGSLMSPTSSTLMTLTDSVTEQTLTFDTGILNIIPGTGIDIDFPASTAAALVLKPNSTTAAAITMAIQGRPLAGSRSLLSPNWFSASASDVFTSQTFRCWDTQFSSFTAGQITSCTYVGYDGSLFTISPSASSGAGNNAYFLRSAGVVIGSANGTWAEVATASLRGPRRSISSFFTDLVACLILEAPTGTNKKQDTTTDLDQITLYLKQQTAQGTAPTNKIGIVVDAQNAGTNRYVGWFGNTLRVTNPSGIGQSVLELRQANTGATAGAHVNFDDKAGNPGSPVTGDLWRNADALNYRKSAATVDLALRPIPISDGGTGQTTAVAAFDALAPTTSQGDIIYHDGTDNVRLAKGSNNTVLRMTSTIPAWEAELLSKDITIESPTTTEDITMFYTPIAITVTEVRVVLVGSASPSLTLQLKHSTDRSAAGNNLTTSAAHTNTTTGSTATLSDDTIPAASYVWIETTASAGTVNSAAIHVRYTVD